uniref:Epstein-Barr virus EBNA-1-like protein n=1 Tax=Oryza sativa subsp. japonica TaxID=39947 RepID=Q6Z9R6_ORYSJ|nr:Epstein-Barr virus EBNA-1-like protein [Oryza sativa Japonica Group]
MARGAVKGASWRSAAAAKAATERMTPARKKKGKRREKKGLAPLPIREKGGGERGDAAEGGGMLPPSLGGLRAEWQGPGSDDGERFGAARRHGRQARAGADDGGDQTVGHSAYARGKQRAASARARAREHGAPEAALRAGSSREGRGALGVGDSRARARGARAERRGSGERDARRGSRMREHRAGKAERG